VRSWKGEGLKGERNEHPNWPTAIINIARGIAPGKRYA